MSNSLSKCQMSNSIVFKNSDLRFVALIRVMKNYTFLLLVRNFTLTLHFGRSCVKIEAGQPITYWKDKSSKLRNHHLANGLIGSNCIPHIFFSFRAI